jgi:RNA polymerase sigma-70 factor (ECF subfamily)
VPRQPSSPAAAAGTAPAPEFDSPAAIAERRRIEAAQRDPRHFAALYEANFERIHAYVTRRVRDRHEAQDITSEVFHQALANLPRFEYRGLPFSTWLYRIAANAITDRAKRAERETSEISFADDPRQEGA